MPTLGPSFRLSHSPHLTLWGSSVSCSNMPKVIQQDLDSCVSGSIQNLTHQGSAAWRLHLTVFGSLLPLVLILSCLFFPTQGRAHTTDDIVSFAITNYTSYVINSDATSGSAELNRDAIRILTQVKYYESSVTASTWEYMLSFRLLDTGGTAVSLVSEDGLTTNATYSLTSSVTLPVKFGTFILRDTVTNAYSANLRPAQRLDPYQQYTVEMRLYKRQGIGRFAATGDLASDGPRTYYHFPSTDSADAEVNVIAKMNSVGWTRTSALAGVSGLENFELSGQYTLYRYDQFLSAIATDNIIVRLKYLLTDLSTGLPVPLKQDYEDFVEPMETYANQLFPFFRPRVPRVRVFTETLHVQPSDGTQLDPVNKTYQLTVTVSHVETPGQTPVDGNQVLSPGQRLLHFNGRLYFGAIETRFTSLASVPPFLGAVVAGVQSSISVNAASGYVVGKPDHTYGDGTALPVVLRANGNAEYQGAVPVTLTAPAIDLDELNHIRFLRTAETLDMSGAKANLTVALPTGFGYRLDLNSRILNGTVVFNSVALGQALQPLKDLTLTTPVYGCEETKPLWVGADAMTWDLSRGSFVLKANGFAQYVRKEEIVKLAGAPVPAAMRVKPSNEKYLFFIHKLISSEVVVRADNNGAALMSAEFELAPGAMTAHFPLGTDVLWNDHTALVVEDDMILPKASVLRNVDAVGVPYARDCTAPDCGPGTGPDQLVLKAQGAELLFSLDGGLMGAGDIVTPKELTWGWINEPSILRYVHRVEAFKEARFLMAGFFLRGDQTTNNILVRPGVLLLSGVSTNSPNQMERFGTPEYVEGLGDYPGLNFRVGDDGAKKAESVLAAEPTGTYPLTGRSKYYTRPGGVNGIHEAVFGAFPDKMKIYGYDFKFGNFGLSYLDSKNWESRTEGSLHVQYPAGIDQHFEELKFNCLGGLEDAKVPPGEVGLGKVLQYWQGDFSTLAIKFERKAAAVCDPGEGSLVLGIEAFAQYVDSKLYGEVGFHPNGNIITLADGTLDPPFDSRLKLPNNFTFKGPGSEKWSFTPANDAYYNNQAKHTTEPGWLNIAGKMNVPFFEDLKVHMHTSASKAAAGAKIYLMGGWPSHGYETGGKHFFNQNPFDQDNDGFPVGQATRDAYRTGDSGTEKWLVRAQRNWLGVVDLDYPLTWSSTTRAFTSAKEVHNNLLVLDVKHQAKYLSPQNAELTFGAQYSGLPQLNLANMVFSEMGGLQQGVDAALGAANREIIGAGFDRLNEMLEAQMRSFFKPTFDHLVNPLVDTLYSELKLNYNTAKWTDFSSADALINQYCTGGAETFVKRFKQVVDGGGGAVDALTQLDSNLEDVEATLKKLQDVLKKDPSDGTRHLVRSLMQKLVGGLAADFASYFVDDKVNAVLSELDPTLEQILSALDDLLEVVGQIRGKLSAGGEIASELKSKLNTPDVTAFVTKAQTQIRGIFHGLDLTIDNPFTVMPEADMKALIRQKLEDNFFGSVVAANLQSAIKHRVYDLEGSVREATDTIFQQVNTGIRNLVSEVASELSNEIIPFQDKVKDVMGAGKINGYAHINGDDLKLLRLDVYAQLKVPSDMEFHGYLQVKELDSENTPTGCLPPGGKATEVTVGAVDVAIKWISPDLRANVMGKFTFDPSGSGIPPLINMMAGFELTGELAIDPLKVKYLSASMSFGELENYLSAAARIQLNGYEGAGGFFFGKTCSLDPFNWDKDVAGLLGTPPFTGAYAYGEVWIPISEALLGIPASCFFQVSAGVGAGAGYFIEGPTFVGKMLLGASGDLLCIVSVSGEIKMIGVKGKDGLRLKGSGSLEGEICFFFCVGFSKTVGMEYKNGSWDVDF